MGRVNFDEWTNPNQLEDKTLTTELHVQLTLIVTSNNWWVFITIFTSFSHSKIFSHTVLEVSTQLSDFKNQCKINVHDNNI